MKTKSDTYIDQEDDYSSVDVEKGYSMPEISDLAMLELQMVARESITFVGGPAAILLQIAHPLVGAGIADHSTFKTRAISRAEYTQMYIYCMIFGTTSEKAAMRAYVDKAHSRVVGQHNKQSYNAKDPELQVWVAATIYATMVNMYELIYGPLNSTRAERVYQAFSIMGTSLQVSPEMWPKNLTEFQLYWDDMVNKRLCVTPDARAVLHDIFHPAKGLPLWARPLAVIAMPFVKRLTIEQLPPRVRDQFFLKSTKSSRLISGLFITGMSGVYPFMPLFVRQFTKTYMMGQMRRRIKKRVLYIPPMYPFIIQRSCNCPRESLQEHTELEYDIYFVEFRNGLHAIREYTVVPADYINHYIIDQINTHLCQISTTLSQVPLFIFTGHTRNPKILVSNGSNCRVERERHTATTALINGMMFCTSVVSVSPVKIGRIALTRPGIAEMTVPISFRKSVVRMPVRSSGKRLFSSLGTASSSELTASLPTTEIKLWTMAGTSLSTDPTLFRRSGVIRSLRTFSPGTIMSWWNNGMVSLRRGGTVSTSPPTSPRNSCVNSMRSLLKIGTRSCTNGGIRLAILLISLMNSGVTISVTICTSDLMISPCSNGSTSCMIDGTAASTDSMAEMKSGVRILGMSSSMGGSRGRRALTIRSSSEGISGSSVLIIPGTLERSDWTADINSGVRTCCRTSSSVGRRGNSVFTNPGTALRTDSMTCRSSGVRTFVTRLTKSGRSGSRLLISPGTASRIDPSALMSSGVRILVIRFTRSGTSGSTRGNRLFSSPGTASRSDSRVCRSSGVRTFWIKFTKSGTRGNKLLISPGTASRTDSSALISSGSSIFGTSGNRLFSSPGTASSSDSRVCRSSGVRTFFIRLTKSGTSGNTLFIRSGTALSTDSSAFMSSGVRAFSSNSSIFGTSGRTVSKRPGTAWINDLMSFTNSVVRTSLSRLTRGSRRGRSSWMMGGRALINDPI
ncbi:hypothetical protein Ao3042_03965 [Aspergillus oryzae 3.042]|uniref:ER-bound oxygenase mpaB/mpaB'/Rubber oxygenase catalytic domain-containing protein n=1 Tax=Aspergillus oryzae (strain 3.042) TaxID=1160506 RepID=I8IKV0_ASPO3|nr:hypothetical protein Ao3042_03965 [Aspergillus oryzae 3.042]|eukprot:EIT79636.1 hypothetical protein Ao3042_03965 [Aspergillus oryzae 3.042]